MIWKWLRFIYKEQKRSIEGCSKFKSPETRQVQERLVSTLEHMQRQKGGDLTCKSQSGTGPGVITCTTNCDIMLGDHPCFDLYKSKLVQSMISCCEIKGWEIDSHFCPELPDHIGLVSSILTFMRWRKSPFHSFQCMGGYFVNSKFAINIFITYVDYNINVDYTF